MAIAVVQFAHGSRTSAGTLNVTLGSPATVGNMLVCVVSEVSATHQPSHQTDSFSKIGSWGLAQNPFIDVYAARILSGNTGTTVAVTPTSSSGCAMMVYELSTATALANGFVTGHSGTSPVATGSLTTTTAHTMLIGLSAALAQVSGTSWTSQSGSWTNEVNQTSTGSVWGYDSAFQVLSSTASTTWSQTCVPHSEVISVAMIAIKEALAAPVNTVAPAVTGTTTVGQVLSSTTGTWTNNGTSISYSYQWRRDNFGGGTFADIAGAVSNNYTLVDADDACEIKCVVTNTDEYGFTAHDSNQVGPIAEPSPVNTVAPVASGHPFVGYVLATTNGTWTGMGGHTASYAYQWKDGSGNISGATSSTYTIAGGELGATIFCVVSATNDAATVTANSNSLGPVTAAPSTPANTVAPVASGSLDVGLIVSTTDGTWTGSPTFTYQWQRDNAGGGIYANIATNLIPNSDFESNVTGWQGNAGTETLSRTTSQSLTGGASLQVDTVGTSSSGAFVTPAVTATAGVIYTFDVWVKGSIGQSIFPGINFVGASLVTGSTVSLTGAWQEITLVTAAPAGTTAATPLLVLTGTPTTTFYVDHAYLTDNTDALSTASSYTIVDADQGCQIRCTVTGTNIAGAASAESNALEWVDFFLSATIEFGDTFEEFGTGSAGGISRVQSVTSSRGRQTPLSQMSAGQATILFVDQDGALDPSNIDSPYYHQILPLVKCRVRRRFNGTSFWTFNGRVEDWQPQYLPPSSQMMQVPASDAFERLNNTPILSGFGSLTTALAGSNNDLTFTAVQPGEVGDQITVNYVVAGSSTALTTDTNTPIQGGAVILGKLPTRSLSFSRVGLSSGIGQVPSLPPSSVTVQGTDITVNVATNSGGTATSNASSVLAAMNANSDVAALVTTALAAGNTGAGIVAAFAGTLTGGEWAQELTGARITRVLDEVGWDVDLRALDTGTVQVVSKGFSASDNVSALQHIQNVAASELTGYVFVDGSGVFTFHDANHRNTAPRSTISQATFADDGSGFKYVQSPQPNFSKDKIINQATVTGGASGAVPQTVDDTYSQTGVGSPPAGATGTPDGGFGVRGVQMTTELANDSDALAQAQLLVNLYAYPKVRFDQITTFEPPDDDSLHDAWVASVLNLEIGDLVTVKITPPATTSTTAFQAFIEQIADTVVVGQRWKRSFQLSAKTQTSGGGGGGGGTLAMLNTLGGTLILDDSTNGVIG